MKTISVITLATVLLRPALAQTSPPPICFAFNDTSPPPSTYIMAECGAQWIHFTCPVSSAVTQIDVYHPVTGPSSLHTLKIALHQTAGIGVPPVGPAVSTFSGSLSFGNNAAWKTVGGPPANLSAGSTYALTMWSLSPLGFCACLARIYYDPLGTTQLLLQDLGPPICFPTPPTSAMIGPMMRFRGAGCGPPSASVTQLSGPCGSTTPYSYWINAPAAPILGSQWSLVLQGLSGGVGYLFWSGGVNPAGAPIAAGSPCLHYLDQTSLATLANLGAEPLATGTIPPGSLDLTWTFNLTANPIYAGLVLGAQALVVSPTGTISLGGGVFAETTNAIQVTLGY